MIGQPDEAEEVGVAPAAFPRHMQIPTQDYSSRPARRDLTSSTETIYLYDGWRCIQEREWDENGEDPDAWEARRQYVYGGIYIDHTAARLRQASEPLIFDKDGNGDGDCTDFGGDPIGANRYFYCQQANYNVVAMADSTGASVQTVTYDPYGEAPLSGTATGNPMLFQGQRYDSDAALYYFRNRWYHPVLGRFMQRDPAGYVDGMGLYDAFVGHPVVTVDPVGLSQWTTHTESTEIRAIWTNNGIMDVKWSFQWRCTDEGGAETSIDNVYDSYNVRLLPDTVGIKLIIGVEMSEEPAARITTHTDKDCPVKGKKRKVTFEADWKRFYRLSFGLGAKLLNIGFDLGNIEVTIDEEHIGHGEETLVISCCCDPVTGKITPSIAHAE